MIVMATGECCQCAHPRPDVHADPTDVIAADLAWGVAAGFGAPAVLGKNVEVMHR